MKRASQASESIELAIVLALSGGLMDAYSYMARGQVFANAQTGNMLLFGVYLSVGDWGMARHYLLPIVSFAVGIALAEVISHRDELLHLHWRQVALSVEIVLLTAVAFMPGELDLIANSVTSLACAIQVQSFRKLHGNAFATTMCVGNLRSGTHALMDFFHTRQTHFLERCLLYYGTIVIFVIGAVVGTHLVERFGLRTILACPVLLVIAQLIMIPDREGDATDGSVQLD